MQKPGSAGQAVLAKMGGDDRREREDRTISRGIKAKKSAAGAHAVADHAAAAKAGDTFSIVGLFQEMDTDFSGTISTNELRKLINLVRKKSGKPILGVEKMLAKLDDDGDGEVTLTEWQENVPAAFLKVLQMLQKEDLVMSHINTIGTRGGTVAVMGTENVRGREVRNFQAQINHHKKVGRDVHAVQHSARTEAASQGHHAVELDVFMQFDIDCTGKLGRNELRKALNYVRKKLGGKVNVISVDDFLATVDASGDGQVDIHEWQAGLPEALKQAVRAPLASTRVTLRQFNRCFSCPQMRAMGPALLESETLATAAEAKLGGRVAMAENLEKKRMERMQARAKVEQRKTNRDVANFANAARSGKVSLLEFFTSFDDDGSGTLWSPPSGS